MSHVERGGLPEQGDVEASMVTAVAKHMRTGRLEGLKELEGSGLGRRS